MTNASCRATHRRHESAKDRRVRRLSSEARLRPQLCRDAARVATHRGGHRSRSEEKILVDATTETTAIMKQAVDVSVPQAMEGIEIEFLASAPAVASATPETGSEYVASSPAVTSSDRICGIHHLPLLVQHLLQ